MFEIAAGFSVVLSTAHETVFSGPADAVELRTTDGVIAITNQSESYLNLTEVTHLTVRSGAESRSYLLRNAAAGLQSGRLSVLAEKIERVPSAA
jgi:F0F1-type ATP synthase epsilon subunit